MSALTEKGTLPIGVEVDGAYHRDYELREQLVSDAIEVQEDPMIDQSRVETSNAFFNICITARRLLRLGSLPKESITPDLVMGMSQKDFNELSAADARMEARRVSFREKGAGVQDTGSGVEKNAL